MTRATKAILATSVWASGLVAIGALAYSYGGPPRPVATVSVHHDVRKATVEPLTLATEAIDDSVYMPPVEIRGHRAATPAPLAALAPRPRDISEMHCTGWRELEQGANAVRVCE